MKPENTTMMHTKSRSAAGLQVASRGLRHCLICCALLWSLCAPVAMAQKMVSPHPDWKNLAAGKTVELKTKPNYPETTDDNDAAQLVDGKGTTGEPMWYDKACAGWLGPEPIEFTIDLGEVSPIRGVALRAAAGKAGVSWPKRIMLSVSDTGEKFAPLGDVMKHSPTKLPATTYDVVWIRADALKTHGRFVKFIITPTDNNGGMYCFLDEVEVYKGDDAFLKLPLPEATSAANADSPYPDWQNIASGKQVTFNTPPNEPSTADPEDAKQLVDGKLSPAVPMWNDKTIVGWVTPDPVVFTVDLGTVQPIRGVALRLGAGQAGAEWPTAIQVYVSEKGDKFSPVGELMQMLAKKPPAQGYASFWLAADKLETYGRFVKFACSPKNLGTGNYIFIDELEIYRGDDAWLKKPLASIDSPEQWRASWTDIKWQDTTNGIPEAERPRIVKLVDGKTVTGADAVLQQVSAAKEGVSFSVKGEAGKSRSMAWVGKLAKPIATDKCRYALLTFRAEGIRRIYDVQPLVALQGINDQTADNVVTLAEVNLVAGDGRSHTLLTQLPEGFTIQQIKVLLPTEDDQAKLTLERLEFTKDAPEVFGADLSSASSPKAGFAPVNLGASLNGSLAAWYDKSLEKYKKVMDGARTLKPGNVVVSGVPFTIASGNNNLALMPESERSTKRVEFLGKMVDECFLEPTSRHDILSIDVDANAREAFLLLALSAPPIQILGGQPHVPLHLDDIECISIELTYDQGDSELSFPYSLADKATFIPARLLGAYAVAVDPTRKLKKITLHNRQFGPNFAVAAVTLNTSDKPLVQELATVPAPEQTRQNPEPAAKPVTVATQVNRLTIGNRWYECSIDLTQGFVIDRFVNRWNESEKFKLAPSSGLRLRVGDTIYTGRCFKAAVTQTTNTSAELTLTSTVADLPLDLTVTITANDSPDLEFVVKSSNRGTKPLSAELCLPALEGLTIGDVAKTRIYFPQYRAVNTAEKVALRAPYGPEYTQQFMDVYSRPAGTGVMVRTNNTEQQMLHFALRKDDSGVSGGVCFHADYSELAPGASRTYIPVSLIAHNGDWRTALAMHRDWVRTWYKPFRSQDKDYFLNAWEIACYRTSIYLSYLEQKTPPFINEERTQFMTDEVYAFEKRTRGHNADLVHFYNWSYNDGKKANDYGVHSTDAIYKHVGGIDFFRKGIDDIQTRLKTPVSLYTIIDRFRASLVTDEALAKELVDGAWHQVPDSEDVSSKVRGSSMRDGTYYVRAGHEAWTKYVLDDIVKMQRDTGCKMVYIDVFAFWSHLKGHNGVSPREADLKVLKKLKEELPPDVALWAEYPPSDFGSQYHDGALQYYFLHLNEVFARRYNYAGRSHDFLREMPMNAGRYILTRYKTFGLPGYIEASNSPSQVDAMFINGEANQEDTWRLHHSRIRERLNRAYDIKHQYNDCFNTDNPSPFVDTAVEGIIANRFPGKNRTLWTLYNARPRTFSGVVLSVPHLPGARYRDVWNDKEFKPAIENGVAKIAVTLDPQIPGCVVQEVE